MAGLSRTIRLSALPIVSFSKILQEFRFKTVALHHASKFAESFNLQLAHSFPRDTDIGTHLLQRTVLVTEQAVTPCHYIAMPM